MEKFEEEWIESTKDKVGKLSSHLDKTAIEELLTLYSIEDDEKTRKEIRNEIDEIVGLYYPALIFGKKPHLAVPAREDADGEIRIGLVTQGENVLYPFGVSQSVLYNHVMCVSAPSHGKSTLEASVKSELIENNIGWISLDSKSDYAGLVKVHPEILVADARSNLRFNIFEAPPGVEPEVWRSHVIDALAHVGGWGHGVKGYLQKAVDIIVSERGDDFHLGHVYELVKSWSEHSRASQDYRDVLLMRLELFKECGNVFWCRKSMPFEEIRWLIIRTHKVSVEVHALIFEILLLREFDYRLTNGIKDESAELKVFFVDEASKTSLAQAKEHDWTAREISTPTITKFLTMARQFHLGVWASDQLYSALSDALKSVASTRIVGRLNSADDVKVAARDLFLDRDDEKAILKLQAGEWIARTAAVSSPFTISTPHFRIPSISEAEIEAHMANKRFWLEQEKVAEKTREAVSSALSQDEWYLLSHANEHPFTHFSNRLKAGMGKGRLELAKRGLVERGLAVERTVKVGPYRPWKLLELTNDGINLLTSVGHDVRFWKHIKNEGIEHVLWKFLINDRLRKLGFEPTREKRIEVEGGYRIIDVYYEDNSKKVGCEIECSTSDIENKIMALEKLDLVVLAYSTEENLERARKWLADGRNGINGKVRLVLLSSYLEELQRRIRQDGSGRKSDDGTKADSALDRTKGGRKPGEEE